jgi:hypothetical protein
LENEMSDSIRIISTEDSQELQKSQLRVASRFAMKEKISHGFYQILTA